MVINLSAIKFLSLVIPFEIFFSIFCNSFRKNKKTNCYKKYKCIHTVIYIIVCGKVMLMNY